MVAAPFTKLFRKHEKFNWGPEQQMPFETLIAKLTATPMLRKPDFQQCFKVHTDSSSVAMAACLLQHDDEGRPQVVTYFSRKLRDSVKAPIHFGASAVVEAGRHFAPTCMVGPLTSSYAGIV